MRFSIIAIAALVALASAAPITQVERRSLITEVGSVISGLEEGLGVTAIEEKLDSLLGGSLTKLEDKLGVTFAEKLLQLSKEGASPGDLQAIGQGIALIEQGAGITAVDEFLDKATGGAITSLEDALGVTDIEKALGLARRARRSVSRRSLITEVGSVISGLEEGLGVTAIEEKLDALLGGSLTKLEDTLGVTFAEKLLQLSKEGASPGDLQAIGKGIALIEQGAGITAVDEFLDEATGGAITSLEDALGVTDIEKALGLARRSVSRRSIIAISRRSLITEVAKAISGLEEGLGVTALEKELDTLLGGSLTKLEDKLGVTFAEKLLQLSKEGASPGDLQAIGQGIALIEQGAGITAVDEFLDEATGGAITSLEKALGVTDIEKALGLARRSRRSVSRRSLITEVGKAIAGLEKGLGVTALEEQLDSLLGGSLTKLESTLGVTFAEKLLGLSEEGASAGDLQAIGKGVALLEQGLGITAVDEFLDDATGGAITSLEDALGVTDIEKALGLARRA